MAFTRCERCGCKAVAVGIACVCAFAASIPTDLCSPNHRVAVCSKFVAEPVHLPHHDQPSWVRVNVVAVSTSSSNGMGVRPDSSSRG